ncbi:MAG: methyltransferase domain-containing protein [Phycisphaerales bacterium JB040]
MTPDYDPTSHEHEATPLRLGRVVAKPARQKRPNPTRLGARLRRWLGLPRIIHAEGVRYRERTNTPVHRALGPGGPGVKEYDARFTRSGRSMRIRMTNARQYADLGPSVRSAAYSRLASLIRPGDRVLEINAGTGDGSHIVNDLVGPSGACIALTEDRESLRYARERYPSPNLGFELGSIETLHGETEGAFDKILWTLPATLDDVPELARVLRPGGLLIITTRRKNAHQLQGDTFLRVTRPLFSIADTHNLAGSVAHVLTRAAPPQDAPHEHPDDAPDDADP